MVYGAGTIVTILMSNDATAVVLTPAILKAVRKAKVEPLPYLFVCALIANAASFVLPISNPANLVVFHHGMPPLGRWLASFGVPSVLSIAATYGVMRLLFRRELAARIEHEVEAAPLSRDGKLVLVGLAMMVGVLLAASALNLDLGLPACAAALAITAVVSIRARSNPLKLAREISWGTLLLVAGLFVMVRAVESVGALRVTQAWLAAAERLGPAMGAVVSGFVVGVGNNLINNLPLGLLAGSDAAGGACQGLDRECGVDWRGSGAEPVGDGIAGDDSVAAGAAQRGAGCELLGLSQGGDCGDAGGVAVGVGRGGRDAVAGWALVTRWSWAMGCVRSEGNGKKNVERTKERDDERGTVGLDAVGAVGGGGCGIATAAQAQGKAQWEREAQRVTIVRDDWGIAHVSGKTDADAVFGMIYAQCEDDFNRVETNYLTSLGWTAQAEGEKAIWQDLRQRLFIDPEDLKKDYAASPAWLKRLMDAWADGVNYYLATASRGEAARDHALRAVDGALVHGGQHRRGYRARGSEEAGGVLRGQADGRRGGGDGAAGRAQAPWR